ncbi:RNA polymerase sigma factor (sigma-70 family) [Kribbella amoyensis]|uniref:RNA polymerase sigma factor (Sigma-70 family) n=1 Tax=Kribbella amoyensis TaxID=996641 RepID=A0A561B7Z3_9ACTN|nr:RNA polymerase sigma factor [Kribbella amoyensis]TWD75074.1 RNA polymerase sigma factor (sigma-70 family) [Kribbella amoyensis]
MDRHRDAVPRCDADVTDIAAQYLKHKDAMFRVAHSLLRQDDRHLAEDIVQEAVLSLVRNPPSSVESWGGLFVQTVKRKIFDLWKSSARTHERLVIDDATPLEDEPDGDHQDLDPAVVVAEIDEREARAVLVRASLAELARTDPEGARILWEVKALERTSGEVATEMGVSASRVRQHIMRARKKLAEIIEARGGAL